MLSINTNLQSLIVQNNLTKSTNGLNQAIERMTTGFKLNHASDNAAGYSIAQNMTSKLNSYEVARDNISAGLDLLATTQDTISLMQSHGQRIHALITQAQNGTYGAQSLDAINSEIGARIAEINRLYMNTEYNGIQLFEPKLPDWAEAIKTGTSDGFISDIETVTPDVIVSNAADLEDAINNNAVIGIANADVLAEFAKIVNGTNGYSTNDCEGKTIILTDDIDLSEYQEGNGWTPIGRDGRIPKHFQGIFDGQGHKITNLKINNNIEDFHGLFGYVDGELKNVAVIDADIKGRSFVGGLAGCAESITNCYATGTVSCVWGYVGGLAGIASGIITNSYSTGTVSGLRDYVGGLAGIAYGITNSYSTGSVTGKDFVGGLAGYVDYSTGNVTLENVISTGNVSGTNGVGTLIGGVCYTLTDSDANGSLTITSAISGCQNGIDKIGVGTVYDSHRNKDLIDPDYDLTPYLENITEINMTTNLQVGIDGGSSSQITFSSALSYDLSSILSMGAQDSSCYNVINTFLDDLSKKATELGAVSNRLESALDSTGVAIENLTSSRSTLRDADVAKESSAYIKYQILQQAAATLLATANQTPSIALQLL